MEWGSSIRAGVVDVASSEPRWRRWGSCSSGAVVNTSAGPGRWGWPCCNLFTYSARGVLPGPSRVSDSPRSAGNVIYEAFVLMGELR